MSSPAYVTGNLTRNPLLLAALSAHESAGFDVHGSAWRR